MKYIQTADTLEDFKEFKESILSQKLTDEQTYLVRIKETNKFMTFKTTDWQIPGKPIALEYEKESVPTKKFINILLKNKMLGNKHDYTDKNVYVEDIPNVVSFGNLFCGDIDKETMNLVKAKNIINDLSCVEKFEAIEDISGVTEDGSSQNFFCAADLIKIRLPKTLKVIGKSAFTFCIRLNDFIIPENVEAIRSRAFFGCQSLSTLELPASIKELESMLFSNSGINTIIMNSIVPPSIMKTTFKGLKGDYVIYVPAESYDEYLNQWSIIADHILPKEK